MPSFLLGFVGLSDLFLGTMDYDHFYVFSIFLPSILFICSTILLSLPYGHKPGKTWLLKIYVCVRFVLCIASHKRETKDKDHWTKILETKRSQITDLIYRTLLNM